MSLQPIHLFSGNPVENMQLQVAIGERAVNQVRVDTAKMLLEKLASSQRGLTSVVDQNKLLKQKRVDVLTTVKNEINALDAQIRTLENKISTLMTKLLALESQISVCRARPKKDEIRSYLKEFKEIQTAFDSHTHTAEYPVNQFVSVSKPICDHGITYYQRAVNVNRVTTWYPATIDPSDYEL